eukprot:TRINITY_DN8650_c0_g1_i1.p1 TRINITY_DN8650_c0_g1~~TRINITY_DN8650_c0_g1_i1.p1  ORF type:complete len:444 (-),score=146.12 TRINITY_DN8650_c0_g1_i1:257-1588(-)
MGFARASVWFLLIVSVSASLPAIRVDSEHNGFVDAYGRVRIFHGLNIVYKNPPYYPTTLVTDEALDFYEEMGFTMARLGVLWIGAEPARGTFDESYLNASSAVAASLAQRGMYSLIDSHQDILSPKFCGDGTPMWAAVPAPDAKPFAEPIFAQQPIDNNTGYPTECGEHAWASYYFTEQCSTAFQNIYDNYDGLRDAFVGFWQRLAGQFANQSNILGLELMNEPWAGDVYKNPLLLIPGVADRVNLQPMYDQLNEVIRAVWPDYTIFYEPVTWDVSPVGFDHVPGGAKFVDRSVLSWHFYCWIFDNNMKPVDWTLCNSLQGDFFDVRKGDVKRLGGAGFLTEFGLCDATSPDGIRECTSVMEAADRHLDSWSYWDAFELWNTTSNSPNPGDPTVFSRTYAYAIAGRPLAMSFDAATGNFSLSFTPLPAVTEPTERPSPRNMDD